jgi:hypothetical protein
MIVETKKIFAPVVITIENQAELLAFKQIINRISSADLDDAFTRRMLEHLSGHMGSL